MEVWIFYCPECYQNFELKTNHRSRSLFEWFHDYNPLEECPECGHLCEAVYDLYEK